MPDLLIQVLWFLVPAGAANTIPPLAAKLLPHWSWPLDGGLSFRGRRLFGSHKTLRGLLAGLLFATLVHQLQCAAAGQWMAPAAWAVQPLFHQAWWLGPWLGLCALAGDAVKSFCKRQLDIAPGHSWFPWDQVDWILGTLAGSYWLLDLSLAFMLLSLAAGLLLSRAVRIIGYLLAINEEWL